MDPDTLRLALQATNMMGTFALGIWLYLEKRDDALHDQALRSGLRGKTFMDSARNFRVCDEAIPLARRQALPGVQTCVECQRYLEKSLFGRSQHET